MDQKEGVRVVRSSAWLDLKVSGSFSLILPIVSKTIFFSVDATTGGDKETAEEKVTVDSVHEKRKASTASKQLIKKGKKKGKSKTEYDAGNHPHLIQAHQYTHSLQLHTRMFLLHECSYYKRETVILSHVCVCAC